MPWFHSYHKLLKGDRLMKRARLAGWVIIVVFSSMVLFSFITSTKVAPPELRAQELAASQDHTISLSDAVLYTTNYRISAPAGSISGEFFGKDAIKALIDQQGGIGIKIYYGKKSDGTPVLVLVGVNDQGRDMTAGLLEERGWPCPPVCDTSSVLAH